MGSTKRSRALVPALLALAVLAAAAGPSPRATAVVGWQARIEGLIGSRTMSVSVGERGRFLYRHLGTAWRVPASVQKLCMAMALLDRVGPQARIETDAAAVVGSDGVVAGDLWIVGHGDPTTAAG
ncbi:MAG: D-alanyl-D-alanine carboxypeptidase, partial [Actinomycetota bacterium]